MKDLPRLNFPEYMFRFKKNDKGQLCIFDEFRKKFVVLTPEEWVRQHTVKFIIQERKIPASLIVLEQGFGLNKTLKRTDILVYTNERKVFLLVECKAPEVELSQKTMDQAQRYHLGLGAEYVILTNGIRHFCCKFTQNGVEYLTDFPYYSGFR